MLNNNLRKHLSEGILTVIPAQPHPGFDCVYSIIPNGTISCDAEVLSIISTKGNPIENCSGYLEIQIRQHNHLIDFHIHSIFYSKTIEKNSNNDTEESNLRISECLKARKSKAHSLFLFNQYPINPDIDCKHFLNELKRYEELISFDMQQKLMYQQIQVSIINNTKELLIAFHDSFQNRTIYTHQL